MPNQYLLDKQFFMAYLCALRCSVTIQGVPELVTRLAASALLTPRRKVDGLGTLKKSGGICQTNSLLILITCQIE
jgi:hypothetical protein